MNIFVWIPKTGGSSIWKMISGSHDIYIQSNGVWTFGHRDVSHLDGFKFCFMRDPYDRALSLYAYLKERGIVTDTFIGFCRRLNEIEPIGPYNVSGWSQCNPQARWMDGIDFVGRFENIEEDAKRLFEILDLPFPGMIHINKSKGKPVYCKETKRLVEEFYKEDFEAYESHHGTV